MRSAVQPARQLLEDSPFTGAATSRSEARLGRVDHVPVGDNE